MLIEVVERIGRVNHSESRERYIRAFSISLTFDLDSDNPLRMKSPTDIAADPSVRISVDDQDAFNIVLRRKQIPEFMSNYFGQRIRRSEVTKWFKTEAYEEFFCRSVSRCGNQTPKSPTVYTYAEILQRLNAADPQRFDFSTQFRVSEEVMNMFASANVPFPYVEAS